jgi:hypothetical protein
MVQLSWTCRCGSTEWALLSSKTLSVEPGSDADDFVCAECLAPVAGAELEVRLPVTLRGESA